MFAWIHGSYAAQLDIVKTETTWCSLASLHTLGKWMSKSSEQNCSHVENVSPFLFVLWG